MDVNKARRRGRRGLTAVGLAALLTTLLLAALAPAAQADGFGCRASALELSALGVATVEPVVANRASDPCATERSNLASVRADLLVANVGADAVNADTTLTADAAVARASTAQARLGLGLVLLPSLNVLGLGATEATATYQCHAGVPTATGSSRVTGLSVLGVSGLLDTDRPTRLVAVGLGLPLVGDINVARIALNQTEIAGGRLTQRAVEVELLRVDLLGIDPVRIVIGEASVDLTGNPCPPVPEPRPPVTDPDPDPRSSGPGTPTPDPDPEPDPAIRAPVIDDAPPARTPLTDATILYHATDAGVTLECRLDGGPWERCTGRSTYANLSLGQHCFDVRARRGARVGPTTRHCWTVVELAPGCVATYRHGYFIKAGNVALGRRQAVFHATTHASRGMIALRTRSARGVLRRVTYQLDGRRIGSRARRVLRFAELDRDRRHTLKVIVRGRRARRTITRTFRYVNYVAVDCESRSVVDGIAPRRVRVGGTTVRIVPEVPHEIRGTAKLRFAVVPARRHSLRAVAFTLDGRPSRAHLRSAVFTAPQLKADGRQTLTVRLTPVRGKTRVVRIPFRTVRG